MGQAPKANLFVYIPHLESEPSFVKHADVVAQVSGHIDVSVVVSAKMSFQESTLADMFAAKFDTDFTCVSRCHDLSSQLCSGHSDLVASEDGKTFDLNRNTWLHDDFWSQHTISETMPQQFLSELELLRRVSRETYRVVFFGVSTYKLIPSQLKMEAQHLLETVITEAFVTFQRNYPNSACEVLTVGDTDDMMIKRRLQATTATTTTTAAPNATVLSSPGEWLTRIWFVVSGLAVIYAITYYLAFMDYTHDSVLYTTMNPSWGDKRR